MTHISTPRQVPDKTEKAQAQEISLLKTLLAAATEFIYMYDRQGRYLYASESAATVLGLNRSEMLGKTWQELGMPAEFMAQFEAHRKKVMATSQIVFAETPYLTTIGMKWYEYVASPVLDGQGEVEAVVVTTKDITARKQAEEAIYQLASIVESSHEAIVGKTVEGVITSWNKGAEELYGYRAEEIIGKSISIIIPPNRQQELPKILGRIKAGEAIRRYETKRVRKDGTHIEVSVTISPIHNAGGSIVGASMIAHDVTEQKRMVEELAIHRHELEQTNHELRRQRDELALLNLALEEANRVRSQFHATMSHELRTPLASIIGFSQLALDDAERDNLSQRQQSDLQRILKNGQHLLGLINDVLDLSKIEAGRMDVVYTQVDVRALLTTLVEETQAIALVRNLVLRAEVQEGVDFLESDPLKLRQILLNLVANALKFTDQGEVVLSATRVSASETEVDAIALAVKDSGGGIPVDLHEHIFEAFYQADGSYTRKFGGTGLGLSIVKQLTTLLGGKIEVQSALGQGSTFTVLLPIKATHTPVERGSPRLHQPEQEDIRALTASAPALTADMFQELVEVSTQPEATHEQNNLILAVDDNPDVIVLIRAALRDTQYTVIGVQDSLQVLELAQKMHPCAITLDVMLPDLNGWQILSQLKADPATASIPIVMLTVLSEPGTGYILGADGYLIKPFKSDVLLTTLERLTTLKQTSPQAGKRTFYGPIK